MLSSLMLGHRRALAIALCIGGMNCPAAAQPAPLDSMGAFPRVEGRNLEGRTFNLPADFAGERNVVLIAFKREQQADVDAWMPFLKDLAQRDSTLRVYELPVLGRRYRPMRSFIDGGMRGGIPDRAVREATITMYMDKSALRRPLRIATEDAITVLIVDRAGRVLWRTAGRFTEAAASHLAGHLP